MARHLVVGNQTLLSRELEEVLTERTASDDQTHFHVVVPDTPLDHYHAPTEDHGFLFSEHDDDLPTLAEHRLEVVMREFDQLEAIVTGVVGDENPLAAIRHALAIDDYDEIIVSTLPEGISRWLKSELTSRLRDEVDVAVTHVVSTIDQERERRIRHDEVVRAMQADAD